MSVFYPTTATLAITPTKAPEFSTTILIEGWNPDATNTFANAHDGNPNTYFLTQGAASAGASSPATAQLTITYTSFAVGAFDTRPMQIAGLFRLVSGGLAPGRFGALTLNFINSIGQATTFGASWNPSTGNIDVTTTQLIPSIFLNAGGSRGILASDFAPALSPQVFAQLTINLPTTFQLPGNVATLYAYEVWAQDVPGNAATIVALL